MHDGGTDHAADRLLSALDRAGAPVCVGIDPVAERLPDELRPRRGRGAAAALASFSRGVLDAVAGHVACVKLQSACFERCGPEGAAALVGLIGDASERRLEVILDAKRGDIETSAAHYAEAVFGGAAPPDWVTVNGYFGADGIEPFLRPGRGAFVLVRTSNPGGDALQAARLADGGTVAELVARIVAAAGAAAVGESGYSSLGAVVGATKAAELAGLRRLMPQQVFLVPGLGAQGGRAGDVREAFDGRGRGAVVTASRSVIYAFERGGPDWKRAVGDAASRFAHEVADAVR